jgi:hypothetical protein
VDDFIHRVEDRSSLLMMTGHDAEDGQIVEFFEFRHLTFQEFLTAKAMVEGWHRGRRETDTLSSVLEPHFEDGEWSEVIPLAAVLGGKATEALIQRLTERAKKRRETDSARAGFDLLHRLGSCLADEAAARPETMRAALHEVIQLGEHFGRNSFAVSLAQGKYGQDLRDEAGKVFLTEPINCAAAAQVLTTVAELQIGGSRDVTSQIDVAEQLVEFLTSPSQIRRCEGALLIAELAEKLYARGYRWSLRKTYRVPRKHVEILRSAIPGLYRMVLRGTNAERVVGILALMRLGLCLIWIPPINSDFLKRFLMTWRRRSYRIREEDVLFALVNLPLTSLHDSRRLCATPNFVVESVLDGYDQIAAYYERLMGYYVMAALLTVAWYLRAIDDYMIAFLARRLLQHYYEEGFTTEFLICRILKDLGQEP